MSVRDGYIRIAYRLFGRSGGARAGENPRLALSLQKAHIPLRPDMYMATVQMTSVLFFLVGLLGVAGLLLLSLLQVAQVDRTVWLLVTPMPLFAALTIHLAALLVPDFKAMARARDIDAKLPYALNYIATMASAGATPEKIFARLSQQELYGEVAGEAAWIRRDMQLLGVDVVTALSSALQRSPSIRFQDFLQGAITSLTSGGELKQYFLAKSGLFLMQNRQEQNKFLEGLAVLAESFVTVVVAAPLLLLVVLSVLTTFGGSPGSLLSVGYIVILVVLPLAQLGFVVMVRTITPEA